MGERTPNLNLYKPSVIPLEIGWGEEVNGNFDTIDELLNGAAQSVYLIAGKVNYVANAVYTNGVWNRLNTGVGAVRLAIDPSAQTIVVYHAAAGSNPISWTTLQTFSSGGLNAGAKKITNLATPTAASDAATKAYIDGLIAALKLSQIAIDADKNWNGKSITNTHSIATSYLSVDKITFTRKMSVADTNGTIFYTNSNTYSVSSGQPPITNIPTITVPSGLVDGSTITIAASIYSPAYRTPTLTCFINGVSTAALSFTPEVSSWGSSSTTVTIKSGDVISFALSPPLYSGGAPTTGSVKDISLRGNIVDMPMVSIANDPVWPPSI